MEEKQIWVLRPAEGYGKGSLFQDAKDDDPWDPWYDKCFGMVVVADSEEAARKKADGEAYETSGVWIDEEYTDCTPIEEYAQQSDDDILMTDVHHA